MTVGLNGEEGVAAASFTASKCTGGWIRAAIQSQLVEFVGQIVLPRGIVFQVSLIAGVEVGRQAARATKLWTPDSSSNCKRLYYVSLPPREAKS